MVILSGSTKHSKDTFGFLFILDISDGSSDRILKPTHIDLMH